MWHRVVGEEHDDAEDAEQEQTQSEWHAAPSTLEEETNANGEPLTEDERMRTLLWRAHYQRLLPPHMQDILP